MQRRKLNRILEHLHRGHEPQGSVHREALQAELLAVYRQSHHSWRWRMLVNPQSLVARWALGTLMVALLCIGACEVPTSYQVEMGKQLEIQTEAALPMASSSEMLQSLRQVEGVDDASVSISSTPDGPAKLLVYVWGYDLNADALVAKLRGSSPQLAAATFDVRPLEGTVHGKLGDRLGETLFDIHVTAETADEIRAEILVQLAAQGFEGDAMVDVQSDGDTRTISIETSTDVDAEGSTGETQDVRVERQ